MQKHIKAKLVYTVIWDHLSKVRMFQPARLYTPSSLEFYFLPPCFSSHTSCVLSPFMGVCVSPLILLYKISPQSHSRIISP